MSTGGQAGLARVALWVLGLAGMARAGTVAGNEHGGSVDGGWPGAG